MKKELNSYKNTSVNWAKSQGEIGKLLDKVGIKDVRFTFMSSQDSVICEFNYLTEIDKKSVSIGVRILLPLKSNGDQEQSKNRVHRALYYYLKTKFEALEFGLVEFVQEFMPHLVITDKSGQTKTLYEIIAPQYNKGLITGQQGDIKMLPNMSVTP